MSGNYYYLRKLSQIYFLALFIGCVNASCSENLIVKIREKIAETQFALITAIESMVFGLQKYESKIGFSVEIFTKTEGTMAEREHFQQITSQILSLLLKLLYNLRAEEKAGKNATRIGKKELVNWFENYLEENLQKDGVESCEYFLENAREKFRLDKLRITNESIQLLFFYHLFLWEIYVNLDVEEKEEREHLLMNNTSNECPALKHMNQQKLHLANLIYNGPLAVIKQQLLLASSAEDIDFRNMLNVAIQASVFPFVKDRQKRGIIDMACRPFISRNVCFSNSSIAFNGEMMKAVSPEELLSQIEAEMAKWLRDENLAFLFGNVSGKVRTELANLHKFSDHWKLDRKNDDDAFFPVLFLFARFYRFLAEEIWRRFVQRPQTMGFMDLLMAEEMDRFVRETLANNEQIFLPGNEQEKEQKHLHMKLMIVGPGFATIKKEKHSSSDSKDYAFYLREATFALEKSYQLGENKYLCRKLSTVLYWIAAWELRMAETANSCTILTMFREFEQMMAKVTINKEVDKSQCLESIRKFCRKSEEILKQVLIMSKRNAKFLRQIQYKRDVKFNFKAFFAENGFYIKVARLLTELQGLRLEDDFEGETLAILKEIKRAEEKLVQKLSIEEISVFLKKFASSIHNYESRIFHLKMTKEMGGEWTKEQRNCLFKLIDILSRIITLERNGSQQNFHASRELQAELGYLAKELAVLKATIQTAFPSKRFAAKELLESAVRFRMALENFLFEKNFTNEEELAKEYNEFARCLERMDIDGVQRDMSGCFDLKALEKLVDQAKNAIGLDGKVLELVLELLRAHKQSGARHLAVVKLRGAGHMNVSVGLIEYDFIVDGPRRRKFRENVAELTSIFSPEFPIPMAQWGMVETSKADKVFYEMVNEEGWHAGKYGKEENRDCRTFAYIFICRLFDGKCPPPETWPKNFIDLNCSYAVKKSAFAFIAQSTAKDGQFQLQSLKESESLTYGRIGMKKNDHCELKEHRIEFQIEIDMPEKEGMYQTLLPPIVQYQTGKFAGFDDEGKILMEKTLTVQVDAKKLADKPEQIFEANLMANVCTSSVHVYVQEFKLRDRTNSIDFKIEGFPEKFDLLEWRQLPIIRISGKNINLKIV